MILLPSHRHRNGGNLVNEQEGEIPMYCISSSLMIFTPGITSWRSLDKAHLLLE